MVALFATVSAPAILAAPPQLPALMDPANQEHRVGKFIFTQLVTPDLAAAKTFYAGLFGWTFRDIKFGMTDYAEAYLDGHPIAGLIQKAIPAGEHRQSAWLAFISTSDVDATTKAALQHGGKVLFEPRAVADLGREAVLADPQGAVFAVLTSSSGDPPDVLAEPGGWIWSSLLTTDPGTDAGFYQDLFGYEVFDVSAKTGPEHLILASDNYARASVNALPGNTVHTHPYWLHYVRVEDATKMTAKVVAMGGRMLVEPHIDRQGAKVAVVADPLGAPFGLIEWPENESKQVTR